MAERLTVHRAGHAVLTDLGRAGHARQGIAAGGAADQYSARVANILVGAAGDAPRVEVTASDLSFSLSRSGLISVTGAPADVFVGGRARPMWQPLCVAGDEAVEVRVLCRGMRTYVGVNGRLDVPRVFGSHAPDPLLGIGTRLHGGSEISWESDYRPASHPLFRHPLFRLDVPIPRMGEPWAMEVTDGPDLGEFPDACTTVFAADYVMSPHSNHIGLRLTGPAPARAGDTEMLSRGVPVGAVEVPPAGELIVLHRGRPVTAGYPVVAVVTKTAQDMLGQVRPGQLVRFLRCDLAVAVARHRDRQRALAALAVRTNAVLAAHGVPVTAPDDRAHIASTSASGNI